MDLRQKLTSLLVAFLIFAVVVELVRRKKLTEEFSWIWLLAAFTVVMIALWDPLFLLITRITGIVEPRSIVFFFGIVFLILINLNLSIHLSKAKNEIKNIVQKIALSGPDAEAAEDEPKDA